VAETTAKRLLCCWFRHTGKVTGQVYQCWWRIYQEINVFSRFKYHIFYILYPLVTYLLTLPCKLKGDRTADREYERAYMFKRIKELALSETWETEESHCWKLLRSNT
jgi:hypothetical protein